MFQDHWGLRESPFRGWPNPRYFFQSGGHEEALARLQFLRENRRRLGLMVGETGAGKTLLLRVFAASLRKTPDQASVLSLSGASPREFLWNVAGDWGLNPAIDDSEFRLWRLCTDRLLQYSRQAKQTLLLLDDAHAAEPATLDLVLRLAELDAGRDTRLTILLAADADRAVRIGSRLLELSELRIDLEPFAAEETLAYLESSLARAGRRLTTFTREAAAKLHDLSAGNPRRINQLAELALLAGAGLGRQTIEPDVVESVSLELRAMRDWKTPLTI